MGRRARSIRKGCLVRELKRMLLRRSRDRNEAGSFVPYMDASSLSSVSIIIEFIVLHCVHVLV